MKRDRDQTDFRAIAESYAERQSGCIFCEPESRVLILDGQRIENELAFAIEDGFPV